MTNTSRPAVSGDAPDSTAMAEKPDHWGSPRSWLCISTMIAGFTGAGVALTLGPAWTWVAIGAAVFVLGGVAAVVLRVNRDNVIDDAHIRTVHANRDPAAPPADDGRAHGATAAGRH
ncbi:hypothetical protein CLV63_106206 [Murinocardiopsis flavida]|uniref:Uncharacterized protein n=1 Tax=Murinocardiopsis flavida TaxID=645275 RepID=A0A2P8DLT1_9ACTN|nr:hypothetical protein [Murinocardiopsis flavida]PSK98158.1 hypothetical protein CLV63_106206 [Murinocardiopsis flavida]